MILLFTNSALIRYNLSYKVGFAKMKRPYFKKTDLLPICVVLIVAAAGAIFLISRELNEDVAETAEIRVNSDIIRTIDLKNITEAYEIEVNGNLNVTLGISRDGVRFINSECKDKLCVHSGLIEAHESAACLPAGVSVTVKGGNAPDIDGIVG